MPNGAYKFYIKNKKYKKKNFEIWNYDIETTNKQSIEFKQFIEFRALT